MQICARSNSQKNTASSIYPLGGYTVTPRKRVFNLLILALIMLDTIRRMFGDSRPMDITMLVIELLVLLLIAYEVGISILEKRAARKRKKIVDARVAILRDAMSKGQALQHSMPRSENTLEQKWAENTKEWSEQTRTILKSYSAHAEIAFLQEMPISPSAFGSVGQPFALGTLLARLNTLRSIIEKPEVYL